MAGQPVVYWKQREDTLRPHDIVDGVNLQPLQEGESGDIEVENNQEEQVKRDGVDKEIVEELNEKYQHLKDQMEE